MAIFANNNKNNIKKLVVYATKETNDFLFFLNTSRELFNKALINGFKTEECKEYLLMATWLIMVI
jgi:hypothetical protein